MRVLALHIQYKVSLRDAADHEIQGMSQVKRGNAVVPILGIYEPTRTICEVH